MGIKGFSDIFENQGEFKYKDFEGKNVVIDASIEIYRAALGMKIGEQLTNSFGVPTSHINTILLGVILKLKAAGANQFWVFDNENTDGACHNPLKQLELKKRKQKRNNAKEKLVELNKQMEELQTNIDKKSKIKKEAKKDAEKKESQKDDLFSDESEDEENDKEMEEYKANLEKCVDKIAKQKKVSFTLEAFYIEDVIFLLDSLCIPWVKAPIGYESEHLCAMSTNTSKVFGVKMDYVISQDYDTLAFGAKCLIKRDVRKKKLFKYCLADVLEQHDLELDDLIKIGVILGCDFADKTPRIGPKTVIKKFKDVVLTSEQEAAVALFKKKLSKEDIANIIVNNDSINSDDCKPFSDIKKYEQMLDWLQLVKDYNRERIMKQFAKQKLFS